MGKRRPWTSSSAVVLFLVVGCGSRPRAVFNGIEVEAGAHELAASAEGRDPVVQQVRLEPGGTFVWRPVLQTSRERVARSRAAQ